jgi:protein required for attachment to host cells
MNTVWILVCDAARARVFEIHDHDSVWHDAGTFNHAASREKAVTLTGDRMGSRSPLGGGSHHNALAATSPKETEKNHFAHELATMLDEALRAKRFDRWVLVAPPHFLGGIKKELTRELHNHLLATVDHDLVHLDVHALGERLKDVVRIPPDQRAVVREPNKHAH